MNVNASAKFKKTIKQLLAFKCWCLIKSINNSKCRLPATIQSKKWNSGTLFCLLKLTEMEWHLVSSKVFKTEMACTRTPRTRMGSLTQRLTRILQEQVQLRVIFHRQHKSCFLNSEHMKKLLAVKILEKNQSRPFLLTWRTKCSEVEPWISSKNR